jgi:hypothetical protein
MGSSKVPVLDNSSIVFFEKEENKVMPVAVAAVLLMNWRRSEPVFFPRAIPFN